MAQDSIELTLDNRTVTGKAVKHLRKDGIVPAVIHDHGKASVIVQGNGSSILKAYQHAGKHHPVQLNAAGKKYTAMIKTIEFEPRKHALNHVVFNAVNANEKVEAEIPVHAHYDDGNDISPAERANFLVLVHASTVVVSAVSSKLPNAITYNGETLVELGDHISAGDLAMPAGVELVTDPTQSIAAVADPAVIEAANDAAGGDAEEVTGVEAGAVETEHGSAETDDQTSGEDELSPGGRKEKEDNAHGTNPEKH